MKTIRFASSLVVLLAALSASGCSAQNYITVEQARQAVRDFEGNQSLSFGSMVFAQRTDSELGDRSLWDVNMQTGDNTYGVNAVTAEVYAAYYADRYPTNDYAQPFQQTASENAALAYARSKYASFDSMGFQMNSATWEGTHWVISWKQVLAYDAETYNSVDIDIDPQTIQILSYDSVRVPVVAPRQPQLTAQQAIDAAMTDTGIVTLDRTEGPTLMVLPDGSVQWLMTVAGTRGDGTTIAFRISINAETGATVFKTRASGYVGHKRPSASPSPKARPPSVASKKPFAPAKGAPATPNKHQPAAATSAGKTVVKQTTGPAKGKTKPKAAGTSGANPAAKPAAPTTK